MRRCSRVCPPSGVHHAPARAPVDRHDPFRDRRSGISTGYLRLTLARGHWSNTDTGESYDVAFNHATGARYADRVPVGEIPPGMRVCWLCSGVGLVEDETDMLVECAACRGEGIVPISS